MEIRVFATPDTLHAGALDGYAAVVIDALRMTSVAAVAIENGCVGIRGVQEVEEACAVAKECGALTGGERDAVRIPGFDFDNSPLAYTRERVAGHRLVMTTSNGTRAIHGAWEADRLLLGAFINANAVAEAVLPEEKVALVCAGTLGAFSLEDALAAGAILGRLAGRCSLTPDDMAVAVLSLYEHAGGNLHRALAGGRHYNRLKGMGLAADVDFCLMEDTVRAVPERRQDGWFA